LSALKSTTGGSMSWTLGISTLQKNRLSNHKEASDLTEPVQQTLYENYLQVCSENNR
jgi:hypothetical protein